MSNFLLECKFYKTIIFNWRINLMDNTIVYIKCKVGADPLEIAYNSFDEKCTRYYNLDDDDVESLNDIDKHEEHFIVFVEYSDLIIKKMLLGTFKWNSNTPPNKDSLKYSITRIIESEIIISNIAKLSELDLNKDFNMGKYTFFEKSDYISSQISFILSDYFTPDKKKKTYSSLPSEDGLSKLAQKNEYCKRYYNYRPSDERRSEFQRDYERILHSKAFRRMVDKAQVFSASKGDYYRTRMTHTQVVAQIAGAISDALGLNYYLTQAIAIGHDIGHTPFGHQGERTLNKILTGEIPIIKNKDLFNDDFGGFKHNYQSIRVATKLEEEYAGIYGIDLSFQTLEGIVKHTIIDDSKYKLEDFCDYESCKDLLSFDCYIPTTLEGQVVALADEIAQRGHDLDDALESGFITIDELKSMLSIKKTHKFIELFNNVEKELRTIKNNNRRFSDEASIKNNMIVSGIISFFINDIIDNSLSGIEDYISNNLDEFNDNEHCIKKQLVQFSEKAADICKYIEIIVTNKVINSSEIAMFDSNAETIVAGLFKAYYNNPKLLHKGTLIRIMNEFKRETYNVIDFTNSNYGVVSEELNTIVHADLSDSLQFDDNKKKEYAYKRRMLVRAICDYISGMTDSYAISEYGKIVK